MVYEDELSGERIFKKFREAAAAKEGVCFSAFEADLANMVLEAMQEGCQSELELKKWQDDLLDALRGAPNVRKVLREFCLTGWQDDAKAEGKIRIYEIWLERAKRYAESSDTAKAIAAAVIRVFAKREGKRPEAVRKSLVRARDRLKRKYPDRPRPYIPPEEAL